MLHPQDIIYVIGGESIAVESALIAAEGSVIAVEYDKADRETLIDNVDHFGLQNISIIDQISEENVKDFPIPNLVFMVASASMDKELEILTKINSNITVVIYTLDFKVAANIDDTLEKYGIKDIDTIQLSISKLASNKSFIKQPSPWIIVGR